MKKGPSPNSNAKGKKKITGGKKKKNISTSGGGACSGGNLLQKGGKKERRGLAHATGAVQPLREGPAKGKGAISWA